jgi:hypothetical protein
MSSVRRAMYCGSTTAGAHSPRRSGAVCSTMVTWRPGSVAVRVRIVPKGAAISVVPVARRPRTV